MMFNVRAASKWKTPPWVQGRCDFDQEERPNQGLSGYTQFFWAHTKNPTASREFPLLCLAFKYSFKTKTWKFNLNYHKIFKLIIREFYALFIIIQKLNSSGIFLTVHYAWLDDIFWSTTLDIDLTMKQLNSIRKCVDDTVSCDSWCLSGNYWKSAGGHNDLLNRHFS